MNIQALMKQAQAMQKNLMKSKKEIDEKIYEGKSELVNVKINGKREILSVDIKKENDIDIDDLEILEDMIKIAFSIALEKVEKDISDKLGSQTGSLGNLF